LTTDIIKCLVTINVLLVGKFYSLTLRRKSLTGVPATYSFGHLPLLLRLLSPGENPREHVTARFDAFYDTKSALLYFLYFADTFYSAGYLGMWGLETFVCIIQPLPFVYFTWIKAGKSSLKLLFLIHDGVLTYCFVAERGGVVTHYGSDDIFTVLMIPRIYLMFRVFRDAYGMNHESNRHVG